MKVHNEIVQGSEEWKAIRKLRMTASHATAIGNMGAGLTTYIFKIMSEFYSSANNEDSFSSKDTDRGNELEPIARDIYEMETGNTVDTVGFIEHNDYVGCSPDGLVADDGGVEIKCLNDEKYFKHLINGQKEMDSGHVWQVQMCLLITGRKWWDLIYYNPNFKKAMCIYRIEPDKEAHDALLKGFDIGIAMIEGMKKQIESL